MKTLLLDRTDWDLVLDARGNMALAADPYAIAQDVATAVKLFFGELWFSRNAGVPYWSNILGQRPPMSYVRAEMERAALTVPRVVQAKCIIAAFQGRTVYGQLQVIDATGQSHNVTF